MRHPAAVDPHSTLRTLIDAYGHLDRESFLAAVKCPYLLTSFSLEPRTWEKTVAIAVIRRDPSSPNPNILVGRSADCDIPIAYPSVSKRHASFSASGESWFLTDLSSANGTRLNGRLVDRNDTTSLPDLVSIEFGPDARFVFCLPAGLHGLLAKVRELSGRQPLARLSEPPPPPPAPVPSPVPAAARAATVSTMRGVELTDSLRFAKALTALETMGPLVQKVQVVLKVADQQIELDPGALGPKQCREAVASMRPILRSVRVVLDVGELRPLELFSET